MQHHKAYKKSMRTSEEARRRNRAYRSMMKSAIRKVRESANKAEGEKNLRGAVSILDRLARKGIIHRNNAANYKSKLAEHINKLNA